MVLELVEELVEILTVEDETGPLCNRHEVGTPLLIERASLDADVVDRFEVREAAFHGLGLSWPHMHAMPIADSGKVIRDPWFISALDVLGR